MSHLLAVAEELLTELETVLQVVQAVEVEERAELHQDQTQTLVEMH
jgi:hypothetical protein